MMTHIRVITKGICLFWTNFQYFWDTIFPSSASHFLHELWVVTVSDTKWRAERWPKSLSSTGLVSQDGFVSICSPSTVLQSTMPSRMTNSQGNWISQLGSLHTLFRLFLQWGYLTKSQERTNSVPHSQSHVPCHKVIFICIDRGPFLIYFQVTDAILAVLLCGCNSSKRIPFSCNRNSGLTVTLDIQWWTFKVNLSSLSFYRHGQVCPSAFMASCTYMLIVYS